VCESRKSLEVNSGEDETFVGREDDNRESESEKRCRER
jgi:hypothetical protein